MKIQSNKLTVYLIKEEFIDHSVILKEHDTLQTKRSEGGLCAKASTFA